MKNSHLNRKMTSTTSSSSSAITKTTGSAPATIMSTPSSSSPDDDVTTIATKTMIENASEGLPSRCFNSLYNMVLPTSRGKENAVRICDYISSLRSEINPSCSYRKDTIVVLYNLSTFFNNNKPFKEIIREHLLSFLNSRREPDDVDPLQSQKQKDEKINSLENTVSTIQSQIQSLISAFSNMREQPQVDSMAKTLYNSGFLIKAAGKEQLIKAAG